MNKEDFVKIIELIRKQEEKERRLADVMEEFLDGRFVPQASEDIYDALIIALRSIYGSKGAEDIQWWLYEDVKKIIWHENPKAEYKLETASDLYDYLEKFDKEPSKK